MNLNPRFVCFKYKCLDYSIIMLKCYTLYEEGFVCKTNFNVYCKLKN